MESQRSQAELEEANRKLHRRCQELERLNAQVQRRYIGVTNELVAVTKRINDNASYILRLRNNEHAQYHKGCPICRFKQALYHTFVKEQMWAGGGKVSFWRYYKYLMSEWFKGR